MQHQPVKCKDRAHPVPDAWRAHLREIVKALAERDYGLSRGIPCVAPASTATADQIRAYVTDFGEELVDVPDETWKSSLSQWMGTHWEILVDLWTAEEGRSDLVFGGDVVETSAGPPLTVRMVYVP